MWWIVSCAIFFVHATIGSKLTPIISPPGTIASKAVWDSCSHSVFYVDLVAKQDEFSIFRYDTVENRVYRAIVEDTTSAPSLILPINNCYQGISHFLVGFGQQIYTMKWDGVNETARVLGVHFQGGNVKSDPTLLWNTARPNKHGRLYAGTYHTSFCSGAANASIYAMDENAGWAIYDDNQGISGLAFNGRTNKVYYIDSCKNLIYEFDDMCDSGDCNRRIVFEYDSRVPLSSLDIDTSGMLYTVAYGNGQVLKINPRTSAHSVIAQLPVNTPTAVVFGGPNNGVLYIVASSALVSSTTGQQLHLTLGPSLYKITDLGVNGFDYPRVEI